MPQIDLRPTLVTHGTGHPRLYPSHAGHLYANQVRSGPIPVRGLTMVLGSAPDADVVVAGLSGHHAEIHRTERDEYVVRSLAGRVTLNGRPCTSSALHTGDLVSCGPWSFSFARDASTDHVHVRRESLIRPRGFLHRVEHLLFLLYGCST